MEITPSGINFSDHVDYTNKSFSHKVADSMFSFTRIAVGGRKIVNCEVTDRTRNVAIRVLSGIIAFTVGIVLTLGAIAIKMYHSKMQKKAYSELYNIAVGNAPPVAGTAALPPTPAETFIMIDLSKPAITA